MKTGRLRAMWQPKSRRRTLLLLALPNTLLLLVNFLFLFRPETMDRILATEIPDTLPAPPAELEPEPAVSVVVGRFLRGTSLDILLKENGFTPPQIHELFSATRALYDLSKVRAGNRYALEISKADGALLRFRYDIDEDKYLTVDRREDGWKPALNDFPYEKRTEAVAGVITDNLFNAILEAGEKDLLALHMSDIFQWDVDFNTDLRVGDGFRLLVEKQYLEGEFVKYGPVQAAELSNQGKVFQGYRYQPAGGKGGYYGQDGRPLRREMRKSPLQFMAPVSSRFSNRRFHPIFKVYRPHLGIDYSAPEGTPVVAIADGRVAAIGRDGGSGNMIRLAHKGGLASLYLHLSRFASGLRQGASVEQGAVIGYVGSTGLATGAHLDFRIMKNGRYVNPLKVHGTPADPLPAAELKRFFPVRDDLRVRMAAVPLPTTAPQVAQK